ncbi:hypothetical protein LBMAG05_02260 [Actinomycetes bacterium]|nr:hypothetical protein LBMAG05_02260 [Actinomycetes bacterium]
MRKIFTTAIALIVSAAIISPARAGETVLYPTAAEALSIAASVSAPGGFVDTIDGYKDSGPRSYWGFWLGNSVWNSNSGCSNYFTSALTTTSWTESACGDASMLVKDAAVIGWRPNQDWNNATSLYVPTGSSDFATLCPSSAFERGKARVAVVLQFAGGASDRVECVKLANLLITNEPSRGGTNVAAPVTIPVVKEPTATIIKTITGARSIKLNLEPAMKGKKIDVFYQSATGKLTKIVTEKANKKGDISVKTKMKLKKGGNIIFKIGNKIVGEVVVN